MSLADVKHQSRAQRRIQRAIAAGRLPHAYLFHGPDGVGKERLARGLAALLLCEQPEERTLDAGSARDVGLDRLRVGCGRCADCRAVAADTHPDLHLIYRQLGRDHPDPIVRKRKALELGADVLRHFVIDKVGMVPSRGRAKVFIIREADRITTTAQNALLKTLEEPPGTTFLILLVTALDRLLPTTLSRCQVVPFDRLPRDFVRRKLGELAPHLPAEQLDWYTAFSEGSLGRARAHIDNEVYALNQGLLGGLLERQTGRGRSASRDAAGGNAVQGQAAGAIAPDLKSWTDAGKAFGDRLRKDDKDISETEAGRRGLLMLLQLASTWYADILRAGRGFTTLLVNAAYRRELERMAEAWSADACFDAIHRLVRAEREIDLNANTQLCIETLLNDLARIGRCEPVSVP